MASPSSWTAASLLSPSTVSFVLFPGENVVKMRSDDTDGLHTVPVAPDRLVMNWIKVKVVREVKLAAGTILFRLQFTFKCAYVTLLHPTSRLL